MTGRPARGCVVAITALLALAGIGLSTLPAAADTTYGWIAGDLGLWTGRPPNEVRFVGRVSTLPAALEDEMRGTVWKPGCPVPLRDLRLLTLSYWGFDDRPHVGPLVVNASAASQLVWVFHRLFDHRFAIHDLKLAREFHPNQTQHDTPGDPTTAFNCRPVVTPKGPSDVFSQHAYGLAVDINPIENPFVENGYVRNRYSRPFVDRSKNALGMIHDGDFVVRTFEDIGWGWGGHWISGQDYMHFSRSGT